MSDRSAHQAQLLWEELLSYCGAPYLESNYIYTQNACLEHAFKVSLGMHSRIWREHQIIGQIRQSFKLSQKLGLLSVPLQKLLEHCFHLSKKIRGKVISDSLGGTATQFIKNHWIPQNQNILVLGAGDVVQDFLKSMSVQSLFSITLCNRTLEKSLLLKKKFPIIKQILSFEDLHDFLKNYPHIVLGIGSPTPLIHTSDFTSERFYKILDFGMPSTLDSQIIKMPNIHLTSLDSFCSNPEDSSLQEDLISFIRKEIMNFNKKIYLYEQRDKIKKYRKKMHASCEQLMKMALNKCAKGTDPQVIIPELVYKIQQKLLHDPCIALQQNMIQSHHLDFFYPSDAITLTPVKSFESM
jgi:glutamyl-tRNA reductase